MKEEQKYNGSKTRNYFTAYLLASIRGKRLRYLEKQQKILFAEENLEDKEYTDADISPEERLELEQKEQLLMEEAQGIYSLSSNDTIRNEVNGMDQSLLSIKNKKFPSALPVLTMISSENVQNVPAWETAHRNQLDLESGNHQLYIVNGGHYIWYTNLTQVVQLIDEWRIENHF